MTSDGSKSWDEDRDTEIGGERLLGGQLEKGLGTRRELRALNTIEGGQQGLTWYEDTLDWRESRDG